MAIKLPDLNKYKHNYVSKGITLPLTPVNVPDGGLLKYLPLCEDEKFGWPWTEQSNPNIYEKSTYWPKLTIVTPSYNQAKFLEQTIRSILLQNYPNLELIIIDGGSKDGSKEIIQKYDQWISFWQCEKDHGQGNAINLGFSLASGKYLAWINSDDYYTKDSLFKVINRFKDSKADFVYGYNIDFDNNRKKITNVNKIIPLKDYFLRFPSLAQPSCFWSEKIHQPIWEELNCALDYEFWLRIVIGNKRTLIREPLSVANIHSDAKTSDPRMKSKWIEDHNLICAKDAHGPVNDWNKRKSIYNFYQRIFKILEKIKIVK